MTPSPYDRKYCALIRGEYKWRRSMSTYDDETEAWGLARIFKPGGIACLTEAAPSLLMMLNDPGGD
jgi:hypothetical protein